MTIDTDAAYRYQTQIRTNLAQVLWKLGRRDEALTVLDDSLALTASIHPSSRSESAALAGYYRYLNGELEVALPLLLESVGLIAREGAPSRLAKARKIAAVVLHDLERTNESEAMFSAITDDPTGRIEYMNPSKNVDSTAA